MVLVSQGDVGSVEIEHFSHMSAHARDDGFKATFVDCFVSSVCADESAHIEGVAGGVARGVPALSFGVILGGLTVGRARFECVDEGVPNRGVARFNFLLVGSGRQNCGRARPDAVASGACHGYDFWRCRGNAIASVGNHGHSCGSIGEASFGVEAIHSVHRLWLIIDGAWSAVIHRAVHATDAAAGVESERETQAADVGIEASEQAGKHIKEPAEKSATIAIGWRVRIETSIGIISTGLIVTVELVESAVRIVPAVGIVSGIGIIAGVRISESRRIKAKISAQSESRIHITGIRACISVQTTGRSEVRVAVRDAQCITVLAK